MTTADLVGTESDDVLGKSDLVKAVDVCRISSVATSLSSNVPTPTNTQMDNTDVAKSIGDFDIRKFTSAISCAKSKSEIEKIVREYSWKPSRMSSASQPEKISESYEVSGSGDGTESRQSVPETGRSTPLDSLGSLIGNATLTASTKSYSWSSSLPNGSRLETLASNAVVGQRQSGSTSSASMTGSGDAAAEGTVTKTAVADGQPNEAGSVSDNGGVTSQRGSVLPEHHAVSSVTSRDIQATGDRNPPVVDAGDVTQQVAASSKCRSSKSLRVGDFLPPRGGASETTFSSPRVSLIARLSRPRHFDECTLDQSQFDRSVAVAKSFQPAISAHSRLMSTPATSISVADGGSLQLIGASRLDPTTSMSSIVDNTLGLTTGPLEDTVSASLSVHPICYQNATDASSAVVDRDIGATDAISFAGRISGSARPGSPADQTANMSAQRMLRKFPSGRSFHLLCYCSFIDMLCS